MLRYALMPLFWFLEQSMYHPVRTLIPLVILGAITWRHSIRRGIIAAGRRLERGER
jgi:hypothetical protein